jgi:hypothetical protein
VLRTVAPYGLHAKSEGRNRLRLALANVKYHIVTFCCPLLGNSSVNPLKQWFLFSHTEGYVVSRCQRLTASEGQGWLVRAGEQLMMANDVTNQLRVGS